MTAPTHDVAVVGGGIVGLATAWKIVRRSPTTSVVVYDKEDAVARHQTGRNSGVLHTGIYYTPGSAKALMCRRGQQEMIRFCQDHDVPFDLIGKVIVAVDRAEIPRLDALEKRAVANGVRVERLGPDGLHDREPNAAGVEALLVPDAGITDYTAVCTTLQRLLTEAGVELRFGTAVDDLRETTDAVEVSTASGSSTAGRVVTCTGLHSDRHARMVDASSDTRIMPFRGEYYELVPEKNDLVNGLVYPVPDPAFPFLGVHLTKMIGGSVHAGPNAVPALSREGYRWRDVDLADTAELLGNPGVWRLGRKYWRTGAAEIVRSASKRRFVAALQRLVPAIDVDDLVPSPAGVRAQALSRSGALLDDFVWNVSGRVVNVVNAPSPAATASLAIADEIVDRLG